MNLMDYYLWIVVFHIMAVLSWMAMLFCQPRFYVYHTEHKNKKEFVDVVKIQEYKMYKIIGMPAMWATLISGSLMIYLRPEMFAEGGWLHAKLLFVAILVAYSFSLEHFRKKLEKGNFSKSGNFFRAYNEVPTILAILIVGYVITKTFSLLFTGIVLALGAFIIYKVLKQTPKGSQ
jgi:putative membrane protein